MPGSHFTSFRVRHRGLSRSDVVAAVACVIAAVALTVTVLRGFEPRDKAGRDASLLTAIHHSLIVFGNEHGGALPIPGMIDRSPDSYLGVQREGVGPEAVDQNTTANLYSAIVALGYSSPADLVGSRERNPAVSIDDDYDYSAYDPAADRYWDPRFVADLETGSNASFAHPPLAGLTKRLQWRVSSGNDLVHLSSRGPSSGIATSASMSCAESGRWSGWFVFADDHIERVSAEPSERILLESSTGNPFERDPQDGDHDVVQAFTKSVDRGIPVLQHD